MISAPRNNLALEANETRVNGCGGKRGQSSERHIAGGEGRERVLLDLREVQHCGGVGNNGLACLVCVCVCVCGVRGSGSGCGCRCMRPPGDNLNVSGLTFAIVRLSCKRRKIVAKPQAIELDYVTPAIDLLCVV